MSNIQISTINDVLVIDSRLIAEELGIEHRAFRQTIEKYIDEIQEFGVVTFEMSKPIEPSQGGRPERFCYLNEEQATYVMTLSRNTDKVRLCKRNLVKAFSEAKRIIQTVIPKQSDRIKELELELQLMTIKERYMERRNTILELHGDKILALLDGRPDVILEKTKVVTETIVTRNGKSVSFEGKSTAEVGKELGFKTGKEFELWLERIGRTDLIDKGQRAVPAAYVATENLTEVERLWCSYKGKNRQLLLGE